MKMVKDNLIILDRERNPTTCLHNLLAGRSAFLVCGGPSSNDSPLEMLSSRGIWSLAVNNSAGHPRIRPQAFVCADPPNKFSHSIWLDPGILKFVPTPKMGGRRGNLRQKINGAFQPLEKSILDCPNVWGFNRNSWLTPNDDFFQSDGACWGNHQSGVEKTGQPKTVCTMLLAIRLLRYLGASKIYMVGVDFRMTPDKGYSFNQGRDQAACESNSAQFVIVNDWLCEMQSSGVFKRAGLQIFNTFERSGLRAFPFVPFVDAIKEARGIIEETPDCSGWYEKG